MEAGGEGCGGASGGGTVAQPGRPVAGRDDHKGAGGAGGGAGGQDAGGGCACNAASRPVGDPLPSLFG